MRSEITKNKIWSTASICFIKVRVKHSIKQRDGAAVLSAWEVQGGNHCWAKSYKKRSHICQKHLVDPKEKICGLKRQNTNRCGPCYICYKKNNSDDSVILLVFFASSGSGWLGFIDGNMNSLRKSCLIDGSCLVGFWCFSKPYLGHLLSLFIALPKWRWENTIRTQFLVYFQLNNR